MYSQILWELLLLHPFNGIFSRTTWVSRHQKGKPVWILLEQEMMGCQWHQLDHVQIICTLLQYFTNQFYRPDALPVAQPTASKHGRLSDTVGTADNIEHCIDGHFLRHDVHPPKY